MKENFIPKDIQTSTRIVGQIAKDTFEGVRPALKTAFVRKVETYHKKLLRQ